jgi:hypothetical protein
VNQLTTDDLADLGGGSSFHGTRVFVDPPNAEDLQLVEVVRATPERAPV